MNVCLDESDVRVVLDSPVTSKLSCRVLFQLTLSHRLPSYSGK